MGILDFLFGKTRIINDSFWGKMIYDGNNSYHIEGSFECVKHFQPINDDIEIVLPAPKKGPSISQKDFFKQIEKNYEQIITKVIPLIEEEFRKWKTDFKIYNFKKEFIPVFIQLPNCQNTSVLWELSFDCTIDSDHTIAVKMCDFDPKEIHIEG